MTWLSLEDAVRWLLPIPLLNAECVHGVQGDLCRDNGQPKTSVVRKRQGVPATVSPAADPASKWFLMSVCELCQWRLFRFSGKEVTTHAPVDDEYNARFV